MSLKGYVDELNQLKSEINRNNAVNKKLRERCKNLHELIKEYLQEKNQSGLKYNGQAILVESKEKRTNKTKKEKELAVINLLHSLGISNPEDVYNQLEDVKKGESVEEITLKFKNLNRH
jgi:hypothetical protein